MSSESEATHLARLRVKYPGWHLYRGQQTQEWWAVPPKFLGLELLNAPTLDALEQKIIAAEGRRESLAGH